MLCNKVVCQVKMLRSNVAMPMNPAANQPHCKGVLPNTSKVPCLPLAPASEAARAADDGRPAPAGALLCAPARC